MNDAFGIALRAINMQGSERKSRSTGVVYGEIGGLLIRVYAHVGLANACSCVAALLKDLQASLFYFAPLDLAKRFAALHDPFRTGFMCLKQ